MFCIVDCIHFDGIGEKSCAEHRELNSSRLFVLVFNVPVNSCGHVETISEPNHTFSSADLDLSKRLSSTQCTSSNKP